jgi:hypothetical protein
MENSSSNENRMYQLGNLFYELSCSNGYNLQDADRLMQMVDLMLDDDVVDDLIPFWDALRDNAHVDGAFCKMLIQSRLMGKDDIFGIDNEIDKAIYEMQWPEEDDDTNYIIIRTEE